MTERPGRKAGSAGVSIQGSPNSTNRREQLRGTMSRTWSPARCLDVAATAEFLCITPRSVWRLVAKGTLRPLHVPGLRKRLFDRHDLEDLIAELKGGGLR